MLSCMQNPSDETSVIRVVSALTELIMTGELAAGVQLREVELAERLGTSRTPVREAIAQLVTRGLLTKERGRSARVRQPTLEDVRELYELRSLTESYLASKAAELIDPPTVARLVGLEEELRTTVGDGWFECHAAFHITILNAAGRPRFSDLANDLRTQSEPYVRLVMKLDNSLRVRAAREHTQLLEAMKSGDPDAAREITTAHLQSTVEAVDRVYQAARGLHIPFGSPSGASSIAVGG